MQKIVNQFEHKAADDNSVFVEGWANKAVIDDVGDLMNFAGLDMGRFKRNPILLYNHDRNLPIGKVVDSKVTDDGLWIKGRISNSSDKVVSYVRDLVKEGILKTFSIGFDPVEEKNNGQYNEIKKWRLNEISIVTLPANVEAEFSLAKMLGEAKNYDEAKTLVLKAMEGEQMEPEVKPEEMPEEKPAEEKNAFQECVSAKIPVLIEEGRTQDEAVAVAMSMCRDEGKCSIDVMTKEAFALAKEIAAGCVNKPTEEKPEPEVVKAVVEAVAVPVSQPSDDPSNFGSPSLDIMKSQLALLGKISEQLSAMALALAKGTEVVENEEVTETTSEAEEAKENHEVERVKKRISQIVKELGV